MNACDASLELHSYNKNKSKRSVIPLHLPLLDEHLKYLLNSSTKAMMLEVVPTYSPSGTVIL